MLPPAKKRQHRIGAALFPSFSKTARFPYGRKSRAEAALSAARPAFILPAFGSLLFQSDLPFRRLRMRGTRTKNVVAVTIPAVISAIPSLKNTPLTPMKRGRIKHSGMSRMTLRRQARQMDVFAWLSATNTFCSVICAKKKIVPIIKKGVYRSTSSITGGSALNIYPYTCGAGEGTAARRSYCRRARRRKRCGSSF